MSRQLIAYFSASGVTESVAKKMAEAGNADLYEIRPEILYTKKDLDWTDKESRSTEEMKNPASRPALADKNADIEGHDVIFIGFPIWWYTAPTIINTFLESYEFCGKTIVPFATSGGSGIKKAVEMIRNAVPEAITEDGRLLNGTLDKTELKNWIEKF